MRHAVDLTFGIGWTVQQFPDTYPVYRNSTKMLIPFLF